MSPKRLTTAEKEEIFNLRREGRTLQYCASKFQITPEAARQACLKFKEEKRRRWNLQHALEERVDPASLRVDELPLSTRGFRALMALDVLYLSEIAKFNERDVLRLQGVSGTTLREIRNLGEKFGIHLQPFT